MSGRDERILKDFPKCSHCKYGVYWVVINNLSGLNGFCFISKHDRRYNNGPVMCCGRKTINDLNTIRCVRCNYCYIEATEIQLNMIIELGKLLLNKKVRRL